MWKCENTFNRGVGNQAPSITKLAILFNQKMHASLITAVYLPFFKATN